MFKKIKEEIEAFEWVRSWFQKKSKKLSINLWLLFLIVVVLIGGRFTIRAIFLSKSEKQNMAQQVEVNNNLQSSQTSDNSVQKRILSENQSGGITAEQVVINNILSKESDFTFVDKSEETHKKDIRNKLRGFYGEVRVWSDYPIPKGDLEALQRYEIRVDKWVSETSMWIEKNIGFAAREIFLNRKEGGRIWSSNYDERLKRLLSDLERYKIGLEELIEFDKMWVEPKVQKEKNKHMPTQSGGYELPPDGTGDGLGNWLGEKNWSIIASLAVRVIPILLFIFFLKDRYFDKKKKEERNKILKDAYLEICEEILYIERIANNTYSDIDLTKNHISKYPYDDIIKAVTSVLKIRCCIFLSKKIISIIQKKDQKNIRENARELFKYSEKLKKKLKKYSL